MSKHLERIRKEEAERRNKRRSAGKRVLVTLVMCGCLCMFLQIWSTLAADQTVPLQNKPGSPSVSQPAPSSAIEDWRLILVSAAQPLPRDFRVELKTVANRNRVDARIASDLREMLDAARADGVSLLICSAYRGAKKQQMLYEEEIQKFRAKGYSDEESIEQAGRYMQPPGASEHHTGLAVDIVTPAFQNLNSNFVKTDAYQWLSNYAWEYGFILRYPQDKESITGIIFEPWHYRYVGKEHARAIQASGVCLEEYLNQRSETNS